MTNVDDCETGRVIRMDEREDANPSKPKTRDRADVSSFMGLGIALGIGLGSVLGVLMDNLALGVGVGIAIGAGIGAALSSRSDRNRS
jgi:uncharacterized membrane protein